MKTKKRLNHICARQILDCGLALSAGAFFSNTKRAKIPKRQMTGAPQKLAMAAALALFIHTTSAQTWQTVDDFQYIAGQDSSNWGLIVAPNGVLYAAGVGS